MPLASHFSVWLRQPLVSRHLAFCACRFRDLVTQTKSRLTPPFLFTSIASNSITKASFCSVDFFSTFVSHQLPRRDAAKHFAAKEQPAAESWLLCQEPVYSFTITSILLKCHIEDGSLRE
jgi:hypothetical protein